MERYFQLLLKKMCVSLVEFWSSGKLQLEHLLFYLFIYFFFHRRLPRIWPSWSSCFSWPWSIVLWWGQGNPQARGGKEKSWSGRCGAGMARREQGTGKELGRWPVRGHGAGEHGCVGQGPRQGLMHRHCVVGCSSLQVGQGLTWQSSHPSQERNFHQKTAYKNEQQVWSQGLEIRKCHTEVSHAIFLLCPPFV